MKDLSFEDKENIKYHVFIQWLAKKSALDNWLTAMVDYRSYDNFISWGYGFAITGHFTWSGTEQGHVYWSDIADEWDGIGDRVDDELRDM